MSAVREMPATAKKLGPRELGDIVLAGLNLMLDDEDEEWTLPDLETVNRAIATVAVLVQRAEETEQAGAKTKTPEQPWAWRVHRESPSSFWCGCSCGFLETGWPTYLPAYKSIKSHLKTHATSTKGNQ